MSENSEKRVLLINGSPRDNGNTFTALSEWGFGSLRPFEQVFYDVEYAPCQFAVLEHGNMVRRQDRQHRMRRVCRRCEPLPAIWLG